MGRIRTVKPGFFTNEELFELENELKLPVRVAYAGLWTQADREGRFKWRPRELKLAILPYDDLDFSRVLDALLTRGFLVKYEVQNKLYGWIPTFLLHQVINNRESASVLPPFEPELIRVDDACPTRDSRDDDASCGEGKGKERKGKE